MALELRTEYPLDYKAAAGAPVIAQESFGLHEVFSARGKRSKVVTRQNARPFKRRTGFLLAKSLTDGLVFTYYNENNKFLFRRKTMPVYDSESIANSKSKFECTYKTFTSNNHTATPDAPILVLDTLSVAFANDCVGTFTNPYRKTAFTMQTPDGDVFSNILLIDSRFESLIRWLGENKIKVKLTGENTARGYAVYKIREIAYNNSQKLSSEDGFLQFMIERLLESSALSENISDDELDESGDSMKVTSLTSISDFLNCAGITLPENIRLWARRNLAVARSNEVTPEEKRHAQRALSIMLNIKWKSNYFEAIDPDEARRILDEELFGMERVKQRIIETIIQINRTHTLPAYGILLVGPAGTGKSQIAYLIAKILKLPWSTLDMSSINDAEQLTGSSRIYSNAKPGIIMEAFNMAGESNLVFIINELDKATSGNGNGNPADVLLTLLDNLGFTDNYMECLIPTSGVYPIATANYKDQISAPLLSRFAIIDIPDYTREEKKTIFVEYSLPKVLKRIGLKENECRVQDGALDTVLDIFKDTTGIRDLEQAAEHIAAHALYLIEVEHKTEVVYNADMVKELFN